MRGYSAEFNAVTEFIEKRRSKLFKFLLLIACGDEFNCNEVDELSEVERLNKPDGDSMNPSKGGVTRVSVVNGE